jgi:hypothetical protein
MNEMLRDRIVRKLETLSDERGYQVLDFVEYLESKYAERQSPQANVLTQFAEAVEDKLRAGKVSTQTIAQAMGFMSKAMNVLNGVAAAGKSVASDIVGATTSTTSTTRPGGGAAPTDAPPSAGATRPAGTPPVSAGASPAGPTTQPPGAHTT